ncbi:hypothetical protein [Bdellovibrio sp. HCB337]|uniref:hypothetical protein n=1 Tax=Bdellovibrio sp. HCB337 TaxID=3394358 RepID=UPI0039A74F41
MNSRKGNPAVLLKGSQGFLAADFLFSIVIASGLCVVFFCLAFTLSMAEVGQYIAYSVSRAHAAAHKTQDDQEKAAKDKFASLQKNKVLRPLFSNGWFEIGNLEIRGAGESGKNFADRYPKEENGVKGVPQVGIRLSFEAKMLDLKIPLLGSTDPNAGGFKAFLTGLMIREPSSEECRKQIKEQRYKAIMGLDERFNKIAGNNSEQEYIPMEDNGC